MFDNLDKYTHTNHFFFKPTDNLNQVCNAPNDKAGIYVVYSLKKGKIELIYIGRSGKLKADGSFFIRHGGLKDRLVSGKRDGELRRNFWLREMAREGIEALDFYWFVTHDDEYMDCPQNLEDTLLKKYKNIYGELPRWNRK